MDIDTIQKIRSISIASNADLLAEDSSEDAREIRLDGGIVITAETQPDDTVRVSAADDAGEPLDLFRLSISLDNEHGVAAGARACYICYEDPITQSTQCVPMKCGTTVVISQPS